MTVGSAERRGISIIFFLNGTVTGTFASRLPWIADRLHLSSGLLGAVGLMTSIGALATMPFAAQFVHRYGPKAATRVLIGRVQRWRWPCPRSRLTWSRWQP